MYAVLLSAAVSSANAPSYEISKTETNAVDNNSPKTKGLFVEALYSVLKTDGANSNNYVANPTVILNEPIYTAGFGVGYRQLNPSDFGFDVGAQLIQESGSLGKANPAFYQINGNLTYSVSQNFYAFAGPSINYLNFYNDGTFKSVKSSPTLGGQLGISYMLKGLYISASYQLMQFQSELGYSITPDDTISVNNDFKMSGLVTKIGYVF